MASQSFVFLCVLLLLSSSCIEARPNSLFERLKELQVGSTGGGGGCAACTIAVSLLDQLSNIHNKTIDHVLEEICSYFPGEVAITCDYFVVTLGPTIIKLITTGANPDEVCHGLAFCTDPTCALWPRSSSIQTQPIPEMIQFQKRWNPWDWLLSILERVGNHKPDEDFDDDLFSAIPYLRGSYWRGKDCADNNAHVYPGRVSLNLDPQVDDNCNGIYGSDANGTSWEDLLCKDSGARGTIVVGDSAGAHFEIPPDWLTASQINKNTYRDLLERLSLELDLPHKGGYTGFFPSTTSVPVDSVYKRMAARNLCNHRDFQNLGVNGARSGAVYDSIIPTLARTPKDKPVLLFLELIGNDVCSGHHTLDSMTTPQEFKQNILKTLNYLEANLPSNSHVVFVGLADGLVLWDTLWNRTHPIGVEYERVYDYLNCLNISPCWVWMNSNQTVREAGQARADALNLVYGEIMKEYGGQYKQFDMAYYDFPFKAIVKQWQQMGGQTWQLIEPVDGFHPNQMANVLMARYFWDILSKEHPQFLGPQNPKNDVIYKMFGDQGGY
eukprot:TRINITY_DN3995_c0_g1_i1.p1 TRINITY_DN3995_c0_g1~~TRINITY_DN3995_c0_g1_i1.p1  ORF type:complete len:553 (-),score=134.75 TRINITY_DN3995_c0_g1_i1:148-1806(-)